MNFKSSLLIYLKRNFLSKRTIAAEIEKFVNDSRWKIHIRNRFRTTFEGLKGFWIVGF